MSESKDEPLVIQRGEKFGTWSGYQQTSNFEKKISYYFIFYSVLHNGSHFELVSFV